jgi:S-adenosylmethionine/arginine decarboxylase-like enzyme
MLVHKHIVIRAEVLSPPKDIDYMKKWFEDLIISIDMKILSGPHLVYSEVLGNRGFTGVCIIETSHIAMHTWDECDPSVMQLDIYSCKDFETNTILEKLKEFNIVKLEKILLDRENSIKLIG